MGEGFDATRPVQPQQRGVQPLTEPGGASQGLCHLVRSRGRRCRLVSCGCDQPSRIAEAGHGFPGDGFRASDKRCHLLGLSFMQAAQFVERARGFTAPAPERLVEHGWQAEQGQVVRHRGEVHAQLAADLGIGITGIHPAPDELREFERGEVLPLLVLRHLVVGIASLDGEDHGHGGQPGLDGGAPAPAAKADQVAAIVVPVTDHDGLQDAALGDVLRQLLDGLRWEVLARVVGVFVQLVDGHHQRQAGRNGFALEQVQLVE